MKYMGSKEWMLGNSLGEILDENIEGKTRFVDLFAGAGSVSWRMAELHHVPVVAADLQVYSRVLCEAVVERTEPVEVKHVTDWLGLAADRVEQTGPEPLLRKGDVLTAGDVRLARRYCARILSAGPTWNAY